MKFYSEILDKKFDTAKECKEAEALHLEAEAKAKADEEAKAALRKERADMVEQARKHMCEVQERCAKEIETAQKDYLNLRNEFIKDYGYYHYSSKNVKDIPTLFSTLFDIL